jgi:archaetidylinositol phosphate synthase
MLTKLKQQIQEMLATEARIAHRLRLTPNRISVIGIILALLAALAYAEWQSDKLYLLVVAAVLLLLSGFCDVLDGVVARFYQQATPFGGFLDSLLDRYADAAVYLGIIISGLCDVLWGSLAIIGSLLVSYSRARAEAAGTKMESVGLAERAERIIILFIATLVAFFWQPQTKTIMNYGIILLAIVSNLTVLQRTYYAYKKLRK